MSKKTFGKIIPKYLHRKWFHSFTEQHTVKVVALHHHLENCHLLRSLIIRFLLLTTRGLAAHNFLHVTKLTAVSASRSEPVTTHLGHRVLIGCETQEYLTLYVLFWRKYFCVNCMSFPHFNFSTSTVFIWNTYLPNMHVPQRSSCLGLPCWESSARNPYCQQRFRRSVLQHLYNVEWWVTVYPCPSPPNQHFHHWKMN